jgi:hypothetical protein
MWYLSINPILNMVDGNNAGIRIKTYAILTSRQGNTKKALHMFYLKYVAPAFGMGQP